MPFIGGVHPRKKYHSMGGGPDGRVPRGVVYFVLCFFFSLAIFKASRPMGSNGGPANKSEKIVECREDGA